MKRNFDPGQCAVCEGRGLVVLSDLSENGQRWIYVANRGGLDESEIPTLVEEAFGCKVQRVRSLANGSPGSFGPEFAITATEANGYS